MHIKISYSNVKLAKWFIFEHFSMKKEIKHSTDIHTRYVR